jgi:hypothetical protein
MTPINRQPRRQRLHHHAHEFDIALARHNRRPAAITRIPRRRAKVVVAILAVRKYQQEVLRLGERDEITARLKHIVHPASTTMESKHERSWAGGGISLWDVEDEPAFDAVGAH